MLLDGVQDPGNAGALLRVAAAAGVHWVFATPGTTALWAPKVMRAAMGGHFALNLVEGVAAALVARSAPDAAWIAADAGQGTALWAARLDAPQVGWVFGAEGAGLSEAAAAICSLRVRIPLAPRIESLNVVAAAAVCLFERRRQASASAVAR
jgi:TrmH family RNA methyltransferase